MPKFGTQSKDKLETCHIKIQAIMNEVIRHIDISVIFGKRGKLEQNVLVKEGRSKLKYPLSLHNSEPSRAIDIMLWNKVKPRFRWNDIKQMQFVAGYVRATADSMGIKLRCGCDWNSDMVNDESFYDGSHFELHKRED